MLDLQKKLSVERQLVAVRSQYIRKLEELVALEARIASMSKSATQPAKKPQQPAAKVATQAKPVAKQSAPVPMPGKPISLPVLVQKIVQESKKSLTHVEVAQLAISNGYKTSSKDFPTNVYQALNKLVKRKSIKVDKRSDGRAEFSAA